MKKVKPHQPVRHYNIVFLVMVIFFAISFITNILNSIIVDVKESFNLSLGLAGLLPFSFFIAYGVMSIPAGFLSEKYRDKSLLSFSFLIILFSCLTFVASPGYIIFSLSLFFMGCSMAILQVIINPMLRTAGGEENFAFNSVLAQLVFGLASYASPYLYIFLVNDEYADNPASKFLRSLVPEGLPWVSIYVVFAMLSVILLAVIWFSRYPKNERLEGEIIGDRESYYSLLKNKTTWLYFFGIFCYVGVEQGIGNWISEFLLQYHNLDPQTYGAQTVGFFWAMLTVGCLLGLLLLKVMDSKMVLKIFTLGSMITLLVGLFGSAEVSVYMFPVVGFCISVMWSIIFSLGLNSISSHHGSLSGILCTGIAGGAIFPLLVGFLGDIISLRWSMALLLLPLCYILSIGFWARPLIRNRQMGE